MKIYKETFEFLQELAENNNKPWFDANKQRYITANSQMQDWLIDLFARIKDIDTLEITDPKRSMTRIYRDLRFSKDKTPYSPRMSAMLYRSKQELKCNFYVHIEPNNSFIGGGLYMPTSAQLKLIRDDIDYSAAGLKEVIAKKSFKDAFGTMTGEKLLRVPKGYAPDHKEAELLKMKQYLVMKNFKDDEISQENFTDKVLKIYKEALPLFFYLDRALDFKE